MIDRGTASVTIRTALSMQVCVPRHWTDDQVIEFAEEQNRCGTVNGWQIRREGDRLLAGAKERVTCADSIGHVHIVLDA